MSDYFPPPAVEAVTQRTQPLAAILFFVVLAALSWIVFVEGGMPPYNGPSETVAMLSVMVPYLIAGMVFLLVSFALQQAPWTFGRMIGAVATVFIGVVLLALAGLLLWVTVLN